MNIKHIKQYQLSVKYKFLQKNILALKNEKKKERYFKRDLKHCLNKNSWIWFLILRNVLLMLPGKGGGGKKCKIRTWFQNVSRCFNSGINNFLLIVLF